MSERKRSTVVELGSGYGGPYVEQYQQIGAVFVALDIERLSLVRLRKNYPQTEALCASAEHLPISANSIDKLLIQFPHSWLLAPGLQSGSDILDDGWFREFSRVLKDGGELEIIGDYYLRPDSIIKTASRFFELKGEVKAVSPWRLEEIGSDEALDLIGSSRTRPGVLSCPVISFTKKVGEISSQW